MKRQTIGCNKVFTSCTFEKGRMSRYIENSQNIAIKILITKWAKDIRYFMKEDMQMTNMHMKRHSVSLAIIERQIQAMM